MKRKVLSLFAVCLLLSAASCKDDDWTVVDGAAPTTTLESSHIRTEAGHSINIKGTITDADGISKIELMCPDLFMKKTIDIIDIYGEPLKEYDLDYTFKVDNHNKADEYPVEISVTDVAGQVTTSIVKVTLDGDFTAPFFVVAPAAESTVLAEEGQPLLELEFVITDNIGVDRLEITLNEYDLLTKEAGAMLEGFPLVIDAEGENTYEFSEGIPLPEGNGAYIVQIKAWDLPAQFDEVRSSEITSVVSVLTTVDFPKMYLADVSTVEELNSDIFGVPMRIDRVAEYTYRARYYNETANTGILFIPQKNNFSPICYGIDPSDNSKLINSPGNVKPIVLTEAKKYYEINFNTKTGAYELHTYEVKDYMDPVFWPYGSNNLNNWWSFKDTGDDSWTHADDAWLRELIFGYMTGGPANIVKFVQDKDNPHLYYWEDPMSFNAGDDLSFIIHNWHEHGWWNYIAWRVDDSTDCDIFYYFGGVVKQAYLDWWLGQGVAEWNRWSDESYRKSILYGGGGDKWCKPHVNVSGNYNLIFDSHLGRAKMVPAK